MIATGTWLSSGTAVVDSQGRIIQSNDEFAYWAGTSEFDSSSLPEILENKCPGWKEEILELKQRPGKDMLVGSPSLIVATAQLGLVDEYQLSIQSTIAGSGLQLFKKITDRIDLKLLKTKTFGCGAVTHYYTPTS